MENTEKTPRTLLTAMELRYVAAWQGDNTAAALEAGFKHPKQAAAKLMKKPAVYKAIQEKQHKIIAESGSSLGKSITKTDIANGIVEQIVVLKEVMKRMCHRPQMKAPDLQAAAKAVRVLADCYMLLANLHGYVFNKNLNVFAMFEGRSEEELVYFAQHGYWPDGKPDEPGAVQ